MKDEKRKMTEESQETHSRLQPRSQGLSSYHPSPRFSLLAPGGGKMRAVR